MRGPVTTAVVVGMWRWVLDELIGKPERERHLRILRARNRPTLGLSAETMAGIRAGHLTVDDDDPQVDLLMQSPVARIP